jgi:ribonucleoside-diphosphate reductase alpha chain
MSITKVIKRDGKISAYDQQKIKNAIKKAFQASNHPFDDTSLENITLDIHDNLQANFEFEQSYPTVEDIQNIVEKKIAEKGFFEVARSYIVYREERSRNRSSLSAGLNVKKISVKKKDGRIETFDKTKIEEYLSQILQNEFSETINLKEITEEVSRNVYEGIKTGEINKTIIMSLRARIEKDFAYSKAAAKLLLNEIYRQVIGKNIFDKDFVQTYQKSLKENISKGIQAGRYDSRLSEFDFDYLGGILKPENDLLFNYLGIQTIYDRYLLKDHDQNILEVPQTFWMRIAMGLSLEESEKNQKAGEFYEVMSKLLYTPSTPTLFHSGTTHPQMSSCYLNTVDDDLRSIFKIYSDNSQLSKWSGGIGTDWTNIRGTGALIKATNVESQGVIPFLKIADATTAAINRSGKRRGAACVYLETWHYDIESFLDLRKNTGDDRRRTHDTNTANWIPDLFMKRVESDGDWTLFSPDETPDLHHVYGLEFEEKYIQYENKALRGEMKLYKRLKAKDLWKKMITMLFETGHPWITFKDPSNIRSPQDHVGVVHNSNLCTEITLNTSAEETAVCNLGSLNLSKYIRDNREVDWKLLEKTVATAIRMLDNVIDLNFYPTIEAENSNLKHRPIGLGVMGLQDALYQLDLPFDSEEAVVFSDKLQEFISYQAILNSSLLAKEKGPYSSFKGSKWDRGILPLDTIDLLEKERGQLVEIDRESRMDWEKIRQSVRENGMRNSNCMAIAPTATIANISGCFPTIEPIYKNLYVKSNASGEFTILNRYLIEDLKEAELWNENIQEKLKRFDGSVQNIYEIPTKLRSKYKEVFEIDPSWIIKHAAKRAKWVDQSQSVNIFAATTSGRFLSSVYHQAWKAGLKTTYYLRTLGASAIEKSTIDINKEEKSPKVELKINSSEPALCKIGDPECEACQ